MNRILLLLAIVVFYSCKHKPEGAFTKIIDSGWQFSEADSNRWLSANIPGCVHTDLLHHKMIPDPFYRMNELDLQWIDKRDWVYKTNLEITEDLLQMDCLELHFKGLDTYAHIYLNDSLLLSTNNMFCEWTVNCKSIVHEGDNELKIHFDSPIRRGLEIYDTLGYEVPVSENDQSEKGGLGQKRISALSRKAGYHYGWDWGPRFVTSGIWKPVILKAWNQSVIRNIHLVQQKITTDTAEMNASVTIESLVDSKYEFCVLVNQQEVQRQSLTVHKGISQIAIPFVVKEPMLWWPNGMGLQNLYEINVKVYHSETLIDIASERIGIRTIELIKEKDTHGESFYFKVNGVPLFMKGANYIPPDIFVTRTSCNQYRQIIKNAVDANMNMIRVWGGGVYADDLFYDLCDENGIIVWQDFMFACSLYPDYQGFYESIRQEAIDNVRRLRNHPSIGLWCGNNEGLDALQWQKNKLGKDFNPRLEASYKTIFHQLLPEVLQIEDSTRSYWASSPQSAEGVPHDLKSGDIHYWGVWWGKEPFEIYEKKVGRFMSEYGFQSFPDIFTINKFSVKADHDIYSDVMKHHQRSSIGNGTIEVYMDRDYKKPKDFESFLYVNQLLQAEGIKRAMESHRKNMPYCMGSLFWQINDCWPVASWSSVDYYGRWKALQYFAKKAFEPVHLIISRELKTLTVHLVSDKDDLLEGTITLRLIDFEGKEFWRKVVKASVKNTSAKVFETDISEWIAMNDTAALCLTAVFENNGNTLSQNSHFFVSPKNMKLPNGIIKSEIKKLNSDRYEITLAADKLVKNIYLKNEGGFFSDNFFDLIPGETRRVEVLFEENEDPDLSNMKILSLKDTY